MKRLLKSLLSLCLCFACSASTFTNVFAEEPVVEVESVCREMISRSKTIDYTHPTMGGIISVTVYYTTRYDSGNSSGKYITGITSLKASKKSGWYSVSSTCSITNISYSANHQTADITFTYKASTGAGYNTYSGSITLNA